MEIERLNVLLTDARDVDMNENAVILYENKLFREFLYVPLVNDEFFLEQWYLLPRKRRNNESQHAGLYSDDLGVINLWITDNNFGQGVTLLIFDDGIHSNHSDLTNINYQFSYDFVDDDAFPWHSPNHIYGENEIDGRGTMIAGVIGMKPNNKRCGIGIAPYARIGAIKVLGETKYPSTPGNDLNLLERIAKGLRFRTSEVDVTVLPLISHALGNVLPKKLFGESLLESMKSGRYGKGTIHVVPAGDDKELEFMCSKNPLINSNIFTIPVAAANSDNTVTRYSQACPAIMLTAYSFDPNNLRTGANGIFTTTADGGCSSDKFGGTSAAAAQVAGVVAQIIKTNPFLTWRDIFHILIITALHQPLLDDFLSWNINNAGLWYSSDFGFGLVNAADAVSMAKNFTPVPPLNAISMNLLERRVPQTFHISDAFERSVLINRSISPAMNGIRYLEQVQLSFKMIIPTNYHVSIYLYSTTGVQTLICKTYVADSSKSIKVVWNFRLMNFWGEDPKGNWRVVIKLDGPETENCTAKIEKLLLIFHGSEWKPTHYKDGNIIL